jgi:hydrogenase expression/formation protein HypD
LVDEFRDPVAVMRRAEELARAITKPWTVMEVCGGQTHAILRWGLDRLLPEKLTLIHGPGCPVCVTPVEVLDRALDIAARPGVIFTSFGDMLRVPGSEADLWTARAKGADVRVVYSPLDAVELAARHPDREVVFFAVGFETTAPVTALAAHSARSRGLRNFSLLVCHVLVPPALEAILGAPGNRVNGFLAAGHVCTVMGTEPYEPVARKYGVPLVVTGFEPVDILDGLIELVTLLEAGRAEVTNRYARAVRSSGNRAAQDLIARVFRVVDRSWRGLDVIPLSGLGLTDAFADMDADRRFPASSSFRGALGKGADAPCWAGEVLMGKVRPNECPSFGAPCTPEHPLGAPMVSNEGACAAYYRFRPMETTG